MGKDDMKTLVRNKVDTNQGPGIQDGHSLLELARGWLKQGNPVVAQELLKSAIVTEEADKDQQLRAGILKETGRSWMMQSEWDRADKDFLEAQRLFREKDDLDGAAECARNRGNLLFQQGEFKKSEGLCRQALEWATKSGNHELRATILNTMAAIESSTGRPAEALKTFKLCLADFQASGNRIRQGYVLLNIGLTQTELRQFDAATVSLNDALAIALTEQDLNLVEICYQNISRCYLDQKEIQLARSVTETARKILPGLNSQALETELNLIDCRILRLMGNHAAAEELVARSLRMAEEHSLAALHADLLMEYANLERDTGRMELALSHYECSARSYRKLGMDKGYQEAIRAAEQTKSKLQRS